MTDARAPLILLPGEAKRLSAADAPDVLQLVTSERSNGSLMIVETGNTTVGSGPPVHIHHRDDEAFYVTAGSYRYHVADEDYVCPAGSFVYVPKGIAHGFYALEPGTRKLNIYAPASHEGFYEDLERIMAEGRDDDELRSLFQRHHTEIVGPIPDAYR